MSKFQPRNFVLKTVGYTFLMIFALAACIILSVLFFTTENADRAWFGLGALLGGWLSYYSIISLIRTNKVWKDAMIQAILNEDVQIYAHWKYQRKRWLAFAEQELLRKKKNATWIFRVVVIGIIIIPIIIVFSDDGNADTHILAAVMGVMLIALAFVWFAIKNHQEKLADGFLEMSVPEVIISEIGMLINKETLIILSSANMHLTKVDIEEKYEMPCITFSVRTQGGEHTQTHQHFMLIPEGEEERAVEICREMKMI